MDGAMGTQLQARAIPSDAWQGKEGCNELLNLTAPDAIRAIHSAYLEAGSDAIETNTFGASPVTLGEYGLADQALEINRTAARLAREVADHFSTPQQPRFVFGSIGPGTKLPTLGQISFDALCDSFQRQIEGLLDGGANGILFETCQDLLQIKAGLVAYDQVVGRNHSSPLYVSVTVEQTGALLIGSSLGAVVATLLPFPVDILGLNCATGPDAMRLHLDGLAQNWPGLIACMPNAGLPQMKEGRVLYPLDPNAFAVALANLTREVGLNVIGGCCGTTPAHIRALREALDGFAAPARSIERLEQVSSVFSPVDLTQTPPPLYIGERANATGSKKFRDALLADHYDAAFAILTEQEEAGAHVADLSCAYAGRDETKDMRILVARAGRECRLPMMIDTTQVDVVEEALKLYGGRAIVNSIHFEAGEERAGRVAELARRYGAALVGLVIDETGMAMNAERKVSIAKRLAAFCEKHGLRRGDLFIDALTFTIGSGADNLRSSALETLEAIRRIKSEIPGARTLLGLSNVSFGLKPAGRKVLNAVFLDQCLKAGLDACIINVATIAPLNQIPADAMKVADALLKNDWTAGDPLENFIRFFESAVEEAGDAKAAKSPEDTLADAIIKGKIPVLSEIIPVLLENHAAEDILNKLLVPAMKEVGRLFNEGILQLPFVLKSAEAMKKAVDLIQPRLRKDEFASARATLVLATVSGDVHDIGKNLVDIILSNNGFKVVNLGVKVPVEQMIKAAREHKADALGMSGLLVKSAAIMAENLKALNASDIRIPVFLGGAALTPEFVANDCQPNYAHPVVYCKDAFEGLIHMREYTEKGRLKKTSARVRETTAGETEALPVEIDLSAAPPAVPFLGVRAAPPIDPEQLYPYLNERTLIQGRWGFRRGTLSADEYQKILQNEVQPKLSKLKRECARSGLFKPSAAYGYFQCRGEGETLWVYPTETDRPLPFRFPRQKKAPHRSIPDFFRRDEDVVGFMVVTLRQGLEAENSQLLAKDRYQDYFLLHGFAVELTDALAEYWHAQMRKELGFVDPSPTPRADSVRKYRGSRYSFGYSACPDLSMNKTVCELVHADRIEVSVTESFMLVPEVSVSALIAHHPKATYFNV